MECGACRGKRWQKAGMSRHRQQRFRCPACTSRQTAHTVSAFCGHRFPDDIIALAVRWYLSYRLSYADVADACAARGVLMRPTSKFLEDPATPSELSTNWGRPLTSL